MKNVKKYKSTIGLLLACLAFFWYMLKEFFKLL